MIVFSFCFWTADQILSGIGDVMTCVSSLFRSPRERIVSSAKVGWRMRARGRREAGMLCGCWWGWDRLLREVFRDFSLNGGRGILFLNWIFFDGEAGCFEVEFFSIFCFALSSLSYALSFNSALAGMGFQSIEYSIARGLLFSEVGKVDA